MGEVGKWDDHAYTINDMFRSADDKLFKKVLSIPAHVLFPRLPRKKELTCNLPPRVHQCILPVHRHAMRRDCTSHPDHILELYQQTWTNRTPPYHALWRIKLDIKNCVIHNSTKCYYLDSTRWPRCDKGILSQTSSSRELNSGHLVRTDREV